MSSSYTEGVDEARLNCLKVISHKLLYQLTCYYVCRKEVRSFCKVAEGESPPDDPHLALSFVLTKHLTDKQLLCLSKVSNLRDVKNSIFKTTSDGNNNSNKLDVLPKIDFQQWDLTAMISLLQNVPTFNSSKLECRWDKPCEFKPLNDLSNAHTPCCEDFQPKSNLVCAGCKSSYVDKVICCLGCKICPDCRLKDKSAKHGPCSSIVIREAVDKIRKLRNLLAHGTREIFLDLEKGQYSNEDYPGCKTLADLWEIFSPAVLDILKYVFKKKMIGESERLRLEDDINKVILNASLMDLCGMSPSYKSAAMTSSYAESVMKAARTVLLKKTTFSVKIAVHEQERKLKLSTLFSRGNNEAKEITPQDCSLDSPLSISIETNLRQLIADGYKDIRTSRYGVQLHNPMIQKVGEKSVFLFKVMVKSVDGCEIPECYEHKETDESQKLWIDVKQCVLQSFDEHKHSSTDIRLMGWYVHSHS